jgi:hypothetical protein
MKNDNSMLRDEALDKVNGGTGTQSISGLGTSQGSSASRVKTSDKMQAAMLAFVKG